MSTQDNSVSQKEFNLVSQISHFGCSVAIILLANLIFKNFDITIGILITYVLYAGIKEFWYDEKYESPEIRGSSLEDFLFQVGGAAVAFILTLIF